MADFTPYSITLGATDYPSKYAGLLGYLDTLISPLTGRNKIINGKMEIAQRGTSFAGIANGAFSVDRWKHVALSTTAVITASQQLDVPSTNEEFLNSLRLAVTTADTSIAAGDLSCVLQPIEGYNARELIAKTFTLSFWVRSSKTGVHCVSFNNSGDNRSYVAEYSISAANTWERKTITVSGGLITAGTWDWTNGIGLVVAFALAAGTTYQTTAGAWQTGIFRATSAQVNCLDTIGNIFAITGVQLEVGSVATPFEHRLYGAELALCQRYFFAFAAGDLRISSYGATSGNVLFNYKLPTTMRVTPTVVTQPGSFNVSNTTATLSAASADTVRVSGTVTTLGSFSWENSGTAASVSSEL